MDVVRHMLVHLLAGCIAGGVGAVATVATNTGSLRDLVLHTQGGWIAFALLTAGFVTTFGSVAMAHGVMSLGVDKD